MTADEQVRLRAQLAAARDELHEAQRVAALLDADDEAPAGGPVAVARGVIERDLAARRVEAWVAVLDRLRAEAVRVRAVRMTAPRTPPAANPWNCARPECGHLPAAHEDGKGGLGPCWGRPASERHWWRRRSCACAGYVPRQPSQ